MADEALEKIRSLRKRETLNLKPTPYLKDKMDNGTPIALRDYQKIGVMNMLLTPKMLLGDDTGLGKAQPLYSNVLTPSGWKTIGSLKPGDHVVGSNGKPTKVTGIFPQGVRTVYKVTMSDGSVTECCDEHLWTVRSHNSKRHSGGKDGWKTYSLRQLMEKGLHRGKNNPGYKWMIPVVNPVHFNAQDLPLDPYLVGALIGDGGMTGPLNICNGDPELFELFEKKLPKDCCLGRQIDPYTRAIVLKKGLHDGVTKSSLRSGLKDIGLLGQNWHTKRIPRQYMMGSIQQRIELLRGLMDTDGYVSKDGMTTQFFTSNHKLGEDFVELVQSLGGIAKTTSKIPTLRGKSQAKNGRLAFTVTISLPNEIIPFSLSRKVKRWRPRQKYQPNRFISRVEIVGETECVCIRVEAIDSLYVTDNYIVTHNTLSVLTTCAYIWDKEPDFVPIIVTTKSSLFQWKSEVHKFCKDIEPVVVHGDPRDRNATYEEFFSEFNPKRKRILLMTYDNVMGDLRESVIRKNKTASAKDKKRLKEIKEKYDDCKANKESLLHALKDCGQEYGQAYESYVRKRIEFHLGKGDGSYPQRPEFWDNSDESTLVRMLSYHDATKSFEMELNRVQQEVNPTIKTFGILHLARQMQEKYNNKYVLIMDEMHKLKNHKSQFHEKVNEIALLSDRIIGMTATPVKNRLMEFFSLFHIIEPNLFPRIGNFQANYCIMKMQRIGGGRQVPVVVGYKNLDHFVDQIEPYYLSRKKHEVAKDLPELLSCEVPCELYPLQDELYELAENGMLNPKEDEEENESAQLLRSLTQCQQAVNSPELIPDEEGNPFEGPSSKLEKLMGILEENPDSKVIVYSRFETMISLIEKSLKAEKIKHVRITGKENSAKYREEAKNKFQDPESGVNVILLTSAGAESINLQAASQFVFFDLPYSIGDFLQLIGRMIRIGSAHTTVTAHFLLGVRRKGSNTIDHHILKALKEKKKLADKVAGDNLKDAFKFVSAKDEVDILKQIAQSMAKEKSENK